MNPPFVCCQFHLVDVLWRKLIVEPSPIERAVAGIDAGDVVERNYRAVWPHERFTRDDIDHEDVQRGFMSMTVGTVSRQFFRTDTATLMFHKGLVRVVSPNQPHDPFFVGFAANLVVASTFVANGAVEQLLVPWSKA